MQGFVGFCGAYRVCGVSRLFQGFVGFIGFTRGIGLERVIYFFLQGRGGGGGGGVVGVLTSQGLGG